MRRELSAKFQPIIIARSLVSRITLRDHLDSKYATCEIPLTLRTNMKSHDFRFVDALSVDLEDYYQVEAFASNIPRSEWEKFEPRVIDNTYRVLELLARHQVKATFFVLGWVADRNRSLIREIAELGHEIASHGYHHQRITFLTPAEFRDDLRRARNAIENASGVGISGYRAPTFSITKESLWALEILAEEGFLYDSSIFPIRHDHYGIPDAPRFAHRRYMANGLTIFEFPMPTVRVGGINFPATGGGYLRLLPMVYTRWALRRIHTHDHQPVVIYFHPWELDPEQPRLSGGLKSRVRHYTNLERTATRLDEILSNGQFEPMISAMARLDAYQPATAPVTAIAAALTA
jgi:polysaccharide deacetylase family protein (PEP-CTERM system associated)